MQFHYVNEMTEVIELALIKEKVKNAIDLTFKEPITKELK